jgi:hypothetical protein
MVVNILKEVFVIPNQDKVGLNKSFEIIKSGYTNTK